MNRLADSSSPYLLLHKDNPVDWYPWGPEALERARAEDKPIFLSVGYSTCYWCHVMERESFTDDEVAAVMNRHFVNIKLDREERPDLDEIYMTATQMITQHGGWPNSVFLTPKLAPFYAGTYFPPEDRQGMPGFPRVLLSMAEAWKSRRQDVEEQAASLAEAIRHSLEDRPEPGEELPGDAAADRSYAGLERSFDSQWGGFGGAPKFPTPSSLFLLLEFASERPRAAQMLDTTLDQMARGGIYDHLGGGFHRYATDREWKIPHFEKMLYDNGWLLEVYARRHERSADRQAERVIRSTAGFLERELTSPEGAFWSALDAETDGHEGAFYVWTREELLDVLGEEDFGFLGPLYGFDGPPFFEGDRYVLHHPAPLADQARRRRLTLAELRSQMAPLERKLFERRATREPLLVDDKILADWNGTAISGLAAAGRILGDGELVAQAGRAALFVAERMRAGDGTLLHAWRSGRGEVAAFLADYAFLVRGLVELHRAEETTGGSGLESGAWLESALRLTREQQGRLGDPAGGYFAAAEAEDLLVRSKDFFDGATPSANAVAVLNLLDLAELTGERSWRSEAEKAMRAFAPLLERLAEPARMMTLAARRLAPAAPLGEQSAAKREAAPVGSGLDDEARGKVEVRLEVREPAADGTVSFELALSIAPGLHIYAPDPDGEMPAWVRPLRIDGLGVEILDARLPAPDDRPAPPGQTSDSDAASQSLRIYQGEVRLAGRLAGGPEPGARLRVTFQPCDERRCLPIVEELLELP